MIKVTSDTGSMPKYLPVASWANHIAQVVLSKQQSMSLWRVMGWKRNMEGDIRHASIFAKLYRSPGVPLI